MSSLSQEDLDAGWDALDATGAAAPKLPVEEALARISSPPNSMTVEKTPACIESLVVPAASPALDASEPIAATDGSLTQNPPTPVESSSLPLQAPDSSQPKDHAELSKLPESNQFEWPPFDQMNAVEPNALGSFQVFAERRELFEVSQTHPLPLSTSDSALHGTPPESQQNATADAAASPGNQVAFLASRASVEPNPPAAQHAETATSAQETSAAARDQEPGELAPPESMQIATAQPTVSPSNEVAFLASRASVEPSVPAAQHAKLTASAPETSPTADAGTQTQTGSVASGAPPSPELVEPSRDSTSAVAVETRKAEDADTESQAVSASGWSRQRRIVVWGAAAAIGLIAGYLVLHARHSAQDTAQSAQIVRQSSNVAPAVQPIPKVEAQPAAAEAPRGPEPALPAGNLAANNKSPAESAAAKPLGESFSDAFVKHAATANSNWAAKRPRAADAMSTNRPASPGAGKTGDDPLNVLDQLEKARKAKKQAASRP